MIAAFMCLVYRTVSASVMRKAPLGLASPSPAT
jgi:hypothetical protein